MKYFSVLQPMKIVSDVNIFHSKMSDFVSIPLFGFTLVIKLRNFDFESHWNISLFFDKERYGVRFEYVPWKNVWFCFISNVWLHFSHETEKFDFKGHWNTSIFSIKNNVRFDYALSSSVWFGLSFVVWVKFW